MQAQLVLAEAGLDQAQADVVAGQQALEAQRAIVKDLVVSLYQQGDPTLTSLSGYLGAQAPSDLIRHEEYADNASAKQSGIFDDLTAAEELLRVRKDEVKAARDAVAQQRMAAADNLVAMQTLTEQAVAAKQNVIALVADNEAAKREARQARKADLRMLEKLKREEKRIKKKIEAAVAAAEAAAAAAGNNGFTGESDGFLDYPVAGRVTSPFGYRIHPSTATTACTTARLRRRAAAPRCAPSRTARSSRRTTRRSTATGSTSASAGSTGTASSRSTTTPAATAWASATRSPVARPSATSARPAGPPAATCTSRSSRAATPVDPMGYL